MALKRNRVQTLGVRLRLGNGRPSFEPEFISFFHTQVDIDSLREKIERIDTAGYRVVSQIDDDAIAGIEDEVEKLDATTKGQQNGIDHKKADLNSLTREKGRKPESETAWKIVPKYLSR
ncbi:hypothetical protein CSHISOI_03739 [Colletotrichum shisoi]|uniref:Uncharacterized protein n=1 Tax=Colletotrichum shisoi TaxID=2078593 RepID=A0A5Q4BZD3_9PEZI|nr:hypothetical protein CSHISOI_03739 [Colletotrichum shisoi]